MFFYKEIQSNFDLLKQINQTTNITLDMDIGVT